MVNRSSITYLFEMIKKITVQIGRTISLSLFQAIMYCCYCEVVSYWYEQWKASMTMAILKYHRRGLLAVFYPRALERPNRSYKQAHAYGMSIAVLHSGLSKHAENVVVNAENLICKLYFVYH